MEKTHFLRTVMATVRLYVKHNGLVLRPDMQTLTKYSPEPRSLAFTITFHTHLNTLPTTVKLCREALLSPHPAIPAEASHKSSNTAVKNHKIF